ncbi:lipoprotein signal peptidase [Parahaliea aestuarii]|uniref:Lipoprotein signal peptidase n=2 Tax=Parahaliea aestuarii TaxID=1852021 RepID=A0A5C8ZQZ6_9GAMM|nr:lipoprotein signal peptidase [Parahaliea aestuarii]
MRYGTGAWPWYLLALVVIALDQYTKGLASANLEYARPVAVFSWFNLTLHHNSGAAFSFLSDAGGWQRYFFTAIALAVSALLVAWLYRLQRGQWLLALSLALVLGGAIGNLWDRLVLGYVVDFISVHYAGYYFPAFNLADSAITGGAIGLILDSFLGRPAAGSEEE